MTTTLTPKGIREVAVWFTRWRGNDQVDAQVAPEPRIAVHRAGGVLVYEADSIRRLTVH